MKILPALCLTLATALPVQAETDLGALLAADGITQTLRDLQALPDPTPSQSYALSVTHFLRGIERNFQTRYRFALTEGELGIPGLSLGLLDNPTPEPFDPQVITQIFRDIQDDMSLTRAALPVGEDVAITLSPKNIWFDVNQNGELNAGETFMETAMAALLSPSEIQALQQGSAGQGDLTATIRFDQADTHWLLAYTHLLSGTADMVLAFDPSAGIDRVLGADARMFGTGNSLFAGFVDDEWLNLVASIVTVLETQPDADHTRAAQAHFLEMMDANVAFWSALADETDNDGEWIPNPQQVSVLPIAVPPEIGEGWQAVLAEMRGILTGDLLIPHPRSALAANGLPSHGIDLSAWLQDPVPVDLVGYIHGFALEPYFRAGLVADFEALEEFDAMVAGNFFMFSIFLN